MADNAAIRAGLAGAAAAAPSRWDGGGAGRRRAISACCRAMRCCISTVRPGVIDVYAEGLPTITERIFVAGGFAEVTPERCTVLADEAVPLSALDRAGARSRSARAREPKRRLARPVGAALRRRARRGAGRACRLRPPPRRGAGKARSPGHGAALKSHPLQRNRGASFDYALRATLRMREALQLSSS